MALTYPQDPYSAADLVVGDYAEDMSLALDRAQGLLDLSRLMKSRTFPFWFTEKSAAPGAGSWSEVDSFYTRIPKSWEGENVLFYCEAYVSANNGRYRLVEKGDTVYSTATGDFTDGAYALQAAVTLAIAVGWGDDEREIGIEVYNSGAGTTYVRTSGGTYDYYSGYSEDDG